MIRNVLQKRYALIAKTTISSILASVVITMLLLIAFTEEGATSVGLVVAVIAPLLIAPPLSLIYIRLLERISILEEEQRQLASIDGLTQIFNRRVFDDFLNQQWDIGTRRRSPLGLFLFDVDFFKRYNDHYGHAAGDECLKVIGELLRRQVTRKTDLIARYGGEGFADVSLVHRQMKC